MKALSRILTLLVLAVLPGALFLGCDSYYYDEVAYLQNNPYGYRPSGGPPPRPDGLPPGQTPPGYQDPYGVTPGTTEDPYGTDSTQTAQTQPDSADDSGRGRSGSRSSSGSGSSTDTPASSGSGGGSTSGSSFPTAKKVPGQPNYVISPYSDGDQWVDVSGMESGSQAYDPYTKKIFIVP